DPLRERYCRSGGKGRSPPRHPRAVFQSDLAAEHPRLWRALGPRFRAGQGRGRARAAMLGAAGAGRSVLLFLTLINLFNYLDRYILVALSPAIKRDLGLSDTQVGFLTTAFMGSYFLISPLFGWLGDRKPRLRLMGVGVGL